MKTKSTIKLFATAILATAVIGTAEVHADAKITRNTENDSVEIVSDPYKTFDEADKALSNVKDKYLEEYGSYRAGVNPTEDLQNYEVYAVVRKVSLDETSETTVQNVAKALSHSQSDAATPTTPTEDDPVEIPAVPVEPSTPATPETPSETPTVPTVPVEPSTPATPETPSETPTVPTTPNAPAVTPAAPTTPSAPTVPTVPTAPVTPTTPTSPSETPAVPAAPSVTPSEQVAPVAPSVPSNSNVIVEDNSKPAAAQDQDVKPAQSIVAISDSNNGVKKASDAEVKVFEDLKKETSDKKVESEPIKKGEDRLKELPNTGEVSSSLNIAGLMILSVLTGFFGFKKRNS